MPDMWMDVDAALSEVPVNILPLTDSGDFLTWEESVVYDQAGMDLSWEFTTTAGVTTRTAVTPTSGGDHDWVNQGKAMYTIEIPASGGASISNDTEGFGHFIGRCTGVLGWRGPVIGFRDAALNNALVDGTLGTLANLLADHFWRRQAASIRASSDGDAVIFRSGLGGMSKLVNKLYESGGDLLITEENDASMFGTQALTTNPAAVPIVAMDTT